MMGTGKQLQNTDRVTPTIDKLQVPTNNLIRRVQKTSHTLVETHYLHDEHCSGTVSHSASRHHADAKTSYAPRLGQKKLTRDSRSMVVSGPCPGCTAVAGSSTAR